MANEIEFRWSGQVMEPVDGLAFIGRNPGNQAIYMATGDSGNGMTHGTIAGMLIPELIRRGDHAWAKLYDPSRVRLKATTEFLKENINVAEQFKDYFTGSDTTLDQLQCGEGAVIRRGVHKMAAYRNDAGQLHAPPAPLIPLPQGERGPEQATPGRASHPPHYSPPHPS